MEPRLDIEHSALRLAERLIQLLGRGGFTATYKYAVLVALMDVCMERTTATGIPQDTITTRQLAEKAIELYWPHCEPYAEFGILRQSTGGDTKTALILRHILRFREAVDPTRERSLPLSRARAMDKDGHYEALARLVEWTLIHMPLPRLQRIGREEDRFLYEYEFTEDTPKGIVDRYQRGEGGPFDNTLKLKPGIGSALVALNGVVRPLIHRQWAVMVAQMNNIEAFRLEEFLFGHERISLAPVRPELHALQGGQCFYCGKSMPVACEVDHFVPWARHADNSIDNLVASHKDCNGKKSDYLAAAEHVERWRARSAAHAGDLARIARVKMWDSHPERSLNVARAIYQMLPDDARLWSSGSNFVVIERPRLVAALAG